MVGPKGPALRPLQRPWAILPLAIMAELSGYIMVVPSGTQVVGPSRCALRATRISLIKSGTNTLGYHTFHVTCGYFMLVLHHLKSGSLGVYTKWS